MTITAEDVRAIAMAIAVANRHPEPHHHADEVVAAFNANAAPTLTPTSAAQPPLYAQPFQPEPLHVEQQPVEAVYGAYAQNQNPTA